MFGILYLLFPFQPTSDSYKRYGVTALRCYVEWQKPPTLLFPP